MDFWKSCLELFVEKCDSFPGKLNLFYSEALPPRVPVILQDELFDEHELGGHGGANKQPVLLREDLTNGAAGRGNITAISITALFLSQFFQKKSWKAPSRNSREIFVNF